MFCFFYVLGHSWPFILKRGQTTFLRVPSKSPLSTFNIDLKHEVENLCWKQQESLRRSTKFLLQLSLNRQNSILNTEGFGLTADCPTKLLLNILLKNSKFKLDPFTENRARVTFENRKTIVRSTILSTLGYEDILDANAATTTHKPLVHHCELYEIETFQYQVFLPDTNSDT